nr:Wzy polymerase domain-containing protein [uncultured Albidiferax sp.]
MPFVFNQIIIERLRFLLGSLCIVLVWIYPYSSAVSRDALSQIFSLASLSIASMLFGLSATPVLVYILITCGMLIFLASPNPYWGGLVSGMAGILLGGVACHVGVHFRRDSRGLPWFLFALVTAGLINATEGLLQWFGLVGELYQWIPEPESRGLAFGALRQTNLFATFLCIGSISTVWLVHKRSVTEPMAWFLLLMLMFAVAASGSRTGVLEVTVLAMLAFAWRKKLSTAVTRLFIGQLALLIFAMLVLTIAAKLLDFGFSSGAERTVKMGQDARISIWHDALYLIYERPWLGWGWRETGYAQYATLFERRHEGIFDNVHNLPLQIFVEFGLLVTAPFLGLVFWFAYKKISCRIKRAKTLEATALELDPLFAGCILLLIVGIHSMLEYPLWYAGFLFLSGLFFGYLLSTKEVDGVLNGYQVWSLRFAKLTPVLLMAVAWVGWQQCNTVLVIYKIPFTNDKSVRQAAMAPALVNASGAWLFGPQLDFAVLSSTVVTPQNALEVRERAERLLHFSAEPLVIQPLLLSLLYLNDKDAFRFHTERFCQAFPSAYRRWSQEYAVQALHTNSGHLFPLGCKAEAR